MHYTNVVQSSVAVGDIGNACLVSGHHYFVFIHCVFGSVMCVTSLCVCVVAFATIFLHT